jgi:DNA-directed RNA polymerase subunit RPC12/RpoP
MPELPSINYSCARCGTTQTYSLMPGEASEPDEHGSAAPREIPSIDFACSRCGAIQTYQLVPIG